LKIARRNTVHIASGCTPLPSLGVTKTVAEARNGKCCFRHAAVHEPRGNPATEFTSGLLIQFIGRVMPEASESPKILKICSSSATVLQAM
jgi:hypothetical protein